ncbi:hypothetical protein SKAU_G00352620 [Synaphobranchus kaupii]|uniref:Integrase catalytic domain-containing protein n=1 Tax=Synaphobranchus kaupii TaxID=118154 RepID=A0A9Q1EKV0_SYNKA|nr:hypothetical protein SKAU_G00352620 [Synaphobranchus kaupii]
MQLLCDEARAAGSGGGTQVVATACTTPSVLEDLSPLQLQEAQKGDPELGHVVQWMHEGHLSSLRHNGIGEPVGLPNQCARVYRRRVHHQERTKLEHHSSSCAVVPEELHSNQGVITGGQVFTKVYRILYIRKPRTTPLHPQSNGLVERFNRTLATQLALLTSHHQRDWDLHLPQVLLDL